MALSIPIKYQEEKLMKLKKIIGVVLVGALALGTMTGCKKEPTAGENATVVTMWSQDTHSKDVVTKLVADWNETTGKKKGIYIDYQVKDSSSYKTTIDLALQSGEAPDFFTTDMAMAAENDYIASLEELPGGEELIEKYKDYEREDKTTYKGKWYRVPVNAGAQALLYNKDMFKAAGIVDKDGNPTPPETWDEVRKYAKKLTDTKAKKYGIIFPAKWSGWYGSDLRSPMMSSVGHEGWDPAKGEWDFSGLVPIMETIMGMKKDGSVYPGAEGLDNDPARALFAEGNIGMKFGFSFDYGVLTDQFPATCDWGVAPYPVVDKDFAHKQRTDYGTTYLINKKSLETAGGEAIMEVLKFFTSDEYVRAMYTEGMSLPIDFEIVKDIEVDDDMKQWKEFAALSDVSALPPRMPKKDAVIGLDSNVVFMEEVWSGKITPEEFNKKVSAANNKATKKYYEEATEENLDDFIIKDYNIKR